MPEFLAVWRNRNWPINPMWPSKQSRWLKKDKWTLPMKFCIHSSNVWEYSVRAGNFWYRREDSALHRKVPVLQSSEPPDSFKHTELSGWAAPGSPEQSKKQRFWIKPVGLISFYALLVLLILYYSILKKKRRLNLSFVQMDCKAAVQSERVPTYGI